MSRESGSETAENSAPTAARSTVLRAWLAAFLGFFLLGGAWALAMPIDGNTDELQHVERAYGAADLQLTAPKSVAMFGRAGAEYTVPKSLIPPNTMCMYMLKPANQQSIPATVAERDVRPAERGADCVAPAGSSRNWIKVTSYTGRYSPVYYLPVGIPMLIHPTEGGIVAGRLVSAAMSAALLASAVAVAAWWRKRLLVAAVIVSATPMVVDLMGAVNPSGFEIAAGIAFWASLLALCRAPRELLDGTRARRPILALAAVSGALLLTIRGLGPLWAFLIVAACALVAGKSTVWDLARRRDMRILAGALTAVGLAGIAYNVAVDGYAWYPSIWKTPAPPAGTADALGMFLGRLDAYVSGTVGLFGYSDLPAPAWMVTLWFVLLAAVTVPGLLRASRRHALAIVGVIVVAIGLTFYFDLKYLTLLSWSQYSRYFLPFVVGAWLMAAVLTPESAVSRREERRLPLLIVVAGAPAQLWALAMVMSRFQSIGRPVEPFQGTWTPIWGFYAPVVAMVLGLGALGWLCFAAPGRATIGVMTDEAPTLTPAIAARLKRDEHGLFAAIAQQHDTGEVLMLGWMDDEALRRTLTSGRVTYWSRSRQEYWTKGDTSGNVQILKSAALDCDGDAVLLKVDQSGGACHTGDRTCFDAGELPLGEAASAAADAAASADQASAARGALGESAA